MCLPALGLAKSLSRLPPTAPGYPEEPGSLFRCLPPLCYDKTQSVEQDVQPFIAADGPKKQDKLVLRAILVFAWLGPALLCCLARNPSCPEE